VPPGVECKQTHLYKFLLTENFLSNRNVAFCTPGTNKIEVGKGKEAGIWNRRTSVLKRGGQKVQNNNNNKKICPLFRFDYISV
jgi:hypothetical protein